jgi:hypothetical protein
MSLSQQLRKIALKLLFRPGKGNKKRISKRANRREIAKGLNSRVKIKPCLKRWRKR